MKLRGDACAHRNHTGVGVCNKAGGGEGTITIQKTASDVMQLNAAQRRCLDRFVEV